MDDATGELETLWAHLFGEPPSIRADAKVLTLILVSALPPAPPYRVRAPGEGRVED